MESLIQEKLSQIILREIDIPVGTLATISYVRVSSDLLNGEVGVSIIPGDKIKEVMELLKKEQGSLQHLLNYSLNLKPMPRIEFVYDPGLEKAAKIEKLLEVENGEEFI